MHFHLKVHHWVVWWFSLGVVFGAVALVNILTRNLTRSQEDVILVIGAVNWILGGIVCWAFDWVQIHPARPTGHSAQPPWSDQGWPEGREWHPGSDFVLPGTHKDVPAETLRTRHGTMWPRH